MPAVDSNPPVLNVIIVVLYLLLSHTDLLSLVKPIVLILHLLLNLSAPCITLFCLSVLLLHKKKNQPREEARKNLSLPLVICFKHEIKKRELFYIEKYVYYF